MSNKLLMRLSLGLMVLAAVGFLVFHFFASPPASFAKSQTLDFKSHLPSPQADWGSVTGAPNASAFVEAAQKKCDEGDTNSCYNAIFGIEVYQGHFAAAQKQAQQLCSKNSQLCCLSQYYHSDLHGDWETTQNTCRTECDSSHNARLCSYYEWSLFQGLKRDEGLSHALEMCRKNPLENAGACRSALAFSYDQWDRSEIFSLMAKACSQGAVDACPRLLVALKEKLEGAPRAEVDAQLRALSDWGDRESRYAFLEKDRLPMAQTPETPSLWGDLCLRDSYGAACAMAVEERRQLKDMPGAILYATLGCAEHSTCGVLGELRLNVKNDAAGAFEASAMACHQGFAEGCEAAETSQARPSEWAFRFAARGCLSGEYGLCTHLWHSAPKESQALAAQGLEAICRNRLARKDGGSACASLMEWRQLQGDSAGALQAQQAACEGGHVGSCVALARKEIDSDGIITAKGQKWLEPWCQDAASAKATRGELCMLLAENVEVSQREKPFHWACVGGQGQGCMEESAWLKDDVQRDALKAGCTLNHAPSCMAWSRWEGQRGHTDAAREAAGKACALKDQQGCLAAK